MAGDIARRDLIKKLRNLGFSGPFSGGRHQFMQKGTLKLRIPNPHRGTIHPGLLKEILRHADIALDEWRES